MALGMGFRGERGPKTGVGMSFKQPDKMTSEELFNVLHPDSYYPQVSYPGDKKGNQLGSQDYLDELDRRIAAGEIDVKEYEVEEAERPGLDQINALAKETYLDYPENDTDLRWHLYSYGGDGSERQEDFKNWSNEDFAVLVESLKKLTERSELNKEDQDEIVDYWVDKTLSSNRNYGDSMQKVGWGSLSQGRFDKIFHGRTEEEILNIAEQVKDKVRAHRANEKQARIENSAKANMKDAQNLRQALQMQIHGLEKAISTLVPLNFDSSIEPRYYGMQSAIEWAEEYQEEEGRYGIPGDLKMEIKELADKVVVLRKQYKELENSGKIVYPNG